jgi:hypothetical protein
MIVDNLSSHKSSRTIDKIPSAGVEVLFLPPYSPDLNPIEQIFAKIKAICVVLGQELSDDSITQYPKQSVV